MAIPLQHSESRRQVARMAYETLEPLHVVAYFSPALKDITRSAGISRTACYVGARGGPLGATPASVVTSCFFSFSPALIESGWDDAVAHGLSEVMKLRERAVDATLRETLGDRVEDSDLVDIVSQLREIAEDQDFLGRPLAAAWKAVPWPTEPHLALWHATAVLREWRGDGHLTALVHAGLDPIESSVFHEATHPSPSIRKRSLGRDRSMQMHGWSELDWQDAAERLASRGLLTPGTGEDTLTVAGGELYDALEVRTDDVAVWRGVDDPEALLRRVRPYVKPVIDAGVLPGTARR